MDRYNTQLPQVNIQPPKGTDWFSRHHIWGYGFLGLAFLLAVAFIYQMQYGEKPEETQVCIQVVTTARNPQTGETRDFPTPCEVPEGWEMASHFKSNGPESRVDWLSLVWQKN
jgi:hypothetical protein